MQSGRGIWIIISDCSGKVSMLFGKDPMSAGSLSSLNHRHGIDRVAVFGEWRKRVEAMCILNFGVLGRIKSWNVIKRRVN